MKLPNKVPYYGLFAFVVLGVSLSVVLIFSKKDVPTPVVTTTENQKFHDKNTGITFTYPQDIVADTLTKNDVSDGFVFRATSFSVQGSQALFMTVRTEDAAESEAAAKVLKLTLLDMLVANARRSYPDKYDAFKELSSRSIEVSGNEGVEYVFTYSSKARQLKQKLVILKTEDRIVYFTFQSTSDDFNTANRRVFEPVADSIKL